jgi:hypothetical protein
MVETSLEAAEIHPDYISTRQGSSVFPFFRGIERVAVTR